MPVSGCGHISGCIYCSLLSLNIYSLSQRDLCSDVSDLITSLSGIKARIEYNELEGVSFILTTTRNINGQVCHQ